MPAEIIRFPQSGAEDTPPEWAQLQAGVIGLEVYWSGVFAGLVQIRDGIVHAYCARFHPIGRFQTIDAATGAIAASLAN